MATIDNQMKNDASYMPDNGLQPCHSQTNIKVNGGLNASHCSNERWHTYDNTNQPETVNPSRADHTYDNRVITPAPVVEGAHYKVPNGDTYSVPGNMKPTLQEQEPDDDWDDTEIVENCVYSH